MAKKAFIVIRTETIITTSIFDVIVESEKKFPTESDLAISETITNKPIASQIRRSVDFQVIDKEE